MCIIRPPPLKKSTSGSVVVTLKTFPRNVEAPPSRSPPAPEPPPPPTHPAADEVDDEDHPLLVNPRLAERNRCRSGEDVNRPPSDRPPAGGGSPLSAPPPPSWTVPPPSMGGVCIDGSTELLPASARRCCLLPEDAARGGGESGFLAPARAAAQRTRRLPPDRSKVANSVRPRRIHFLFEFRRGRKAIYWIESMSSRGRRSGWSLLFLCIATRWRLEVVPMSDDYVARDSSSGIKGKVASYKRERRRLTNEGGHTAVRQGVVRIGRGLVQQQYGVCCSMPH